MIGNVVLFPRASFAVDMPPFKSVELANGGGTVELETGAVVDVRRINKQVALALSEQRNKDGTISLAHVVGERALLISVAGPNAEAIAHALQKRVRAPRRDELARVQPRVVDFALPRPLWPD